MKTRWLQSAPFAAFAALFAYLVCERPVVLDVRALPGLAGRAMFLRLAAMQLGLVLLSLASCVALGAASHAVAGAWPSARLRVTCAKAAGLSWAVVLAVLVAGLPGVPLVISFPLPAWAALSGVALGALRFPRARRGALLAGLGMLALPCVCVVTVLTLALEQAPRLPDAAPLDPDVRRAIVASFRGKNPRAIPRGETRTVTLGAEEARALVGWLASAGLHARAQLTLGDGTLACDASIPVPGRGDWLNVTAAGALAFQGGRFDVAVHELRIGALHLPATLVDAAISGVLGTLHGDPDFGTIVAALTRLELTPSAVRASYGRLDAERGMFARLIWGSEAQGELRDQVAGYVEAALQAMEASAPGDMRFEAALHAVFSRTDGSLDARHEALIALGIALGHRGLGRFVGLRLEGEQAARVDRLRAGTTLRGRDDWSRHFTVSGALTALADTAPSDAVGVLKEQLDADGGSGFSFGDLLADRAGTRFAERVLGAHGEELARRAATSLAVAQLLPESAGLPEGIPEPEFLARYGGLKGARAQTLLAEIEARLAALPLYAD